MRNLTSPKALEPFRKAPGDVVQMLPGRSPDMTWAGLALAVLAGFAVAILVLAAEGSL